MSRLVRCTAWALSGLLLAALPLPAMAATYQLNFDGTAFDFLADITVDGGGNVTGISGNVIGVAPGTVGGAITGLVAVGSDPNWNVDNLFNAAGNPYVTNGGLLFQTASFIYNLYSTDPTTYLLSTFDPLGNSDNPFYNPGDRAISLAVNETPIPPALLLFGSALAGLFGLGRRGRARRAQLVGMEAA